MKYCYWSIARGAVARGAMERCVQSAREAGVFKEFHVFTDAPIAGCECYEAQEFDEDSRIESLVYLKAAISKLSFDHFVWVDPKTRFASNPVDLIGALGRAPLHVPLQVEIKKANPTSKTNGGLDMEEYRSLMAESGVSGDIHLSDTSFWIVARQAIDAVCNLAMEAWQRAGRVGRLDAGFPLGYAMHMLCADRKKHSIAARPDLWAPDYRGVAADIGLNRDWEYEDFTRSLRFPVSPAILYQPKGLPDSSPPGD